MYTHDDSAAVEANRLLDENDALKSRIAELERERDAALRCLRHNNDAQVVLARRNEQFLRENMIDAQRQRDAANKRAEQAEAELVEAQSHLIAGAVYEKLDAVNYWKTRAEQAEQLLFEERSAMAFERMDFIQKEKRSRQSRARLVKLVRAYGNKSFQLIQLCNYRVAVTEERAEQAEADAREYLSMGKQCEALLAQSDKRAEQAEAELGAAINQRNEAQRFVNENYDLIRYWRDLFKRANAAKRKARTDARVAGGVE